MKIATYNILSGGFDSYTYAYSKPDRLKLLQKALRKINAVFIGLVDTFRWKDIYSDENLEKMFGYRTAFHIDMNDTRVDKKIGIAVMTDLPLKSFKAVRLYNRDCIKVTLVDNKKLVDIFAVYLDDISEDVRLKEINVLLKNINSNPTVIMGDLNAVGKADVKSLKENFEGFLNERRDFLKTDEYKTYYKPAYEHLVRAEAIELIRSKDFKEAKNKDATLPTLPTKLHPLKAEKPLLRADHIFVSPGLKITDFKVYSGDLFEKTSDHFPISADVDVV